MATWGDAARVALALPSAVQDDVATTTAWRSAAGRFGWDRLLRPGERRLLCDQSPGCLALGGRPHRRPSCGRHLVGQVRLRPARVLKTGAG